MDKSSLKATHTATQVWQEPTPPSELERTDRRHEPEPKRRQYQSCDYCRKRRRACNAVRLGINPFTQGDASVKRMACTTCHRANKSCTFDWLLDLSKGLPQGVKLQLAALDRRAPKRHDSPKKTQQYSDSPSHNVLSEGVATPDSPTKAVASGGDLSSGQRLGSTYHMVHPEPASHSTTYSSVRRDTSMSYASDENDLGDSGREETQSIPTTPWTGFSSSIYDRPLPIHPVESVEDIDSMWTSSRSPSTLVEDDEGDHIFDPCISSEDASIRELDRSRWRAGLRAKTLYEQGAGKQLRINSVVDSHQVSASPNAYHRNDRLILPEFKLAESSIRSFFIAGLKQIYENSMETSLSCWLTVQNSPYERRITHSRRSRSPTASSDSLSTTLYERAHRLDTVFSVLRPKPLTPAENSLASEALKLAVLAFASQWSSSSGSSSRPKAAPFAEGGDSFGSEFLTDSSELEYLIRQSLWTQLNTCLTRLSDCDSFRVITAKLILFFVSRPLNREERDLMRDMLSDEDLLSNAKTKTPVEQDLEDMVRHPEATSEQPGDTPVPKPRSLFDLLGAESRTDHLRTAMQHLSSWSRRIKLFLHRTASPNRTADITLLNQVREYVLQACPQFNLLFWFAIMLDTARSTLHRRPLILLDHETELHIVKHSSDEILLIEEDSKENVFVKGNVLNTTGMTSQSSEIWRPLSLKPSYSCDNPFKDRQVDFIERMGSVLQEATPMTVLIIRKVAHLQAAIADQSSVEVVEHCIAEILSVCGNWEIRFRLFFDNCIAEHATLPFKIRSWYLTIFGHWLVGYLRGTELIDEYDSQMNSSSIQRTVRLSTSLILRLQKESSFKLAQLAQISSLDGTLNAMDKTNYEYHSSIRPGSLLTEPGPDIMIFGLRSACDIMLAWLHILQSSRIPSDSRNTWVHWNVDLDVLVRHILSCIDAMAQLGRLSCFAEINANLYKRRLETVRKESHIVSAVQSIVKSPDVLPMYSA